MPPGLLSIVLDGDLAERTVDCAGWLGVSVEAFLLTVVYAIEPFTEEMAEDMTPEEYARGAIETTVNRLERLSQRSALRVI